MVFQGGCEKDLTSTKITVVKVDGIPMNKESEVPTIYTKPEEAVDLEKGYYHVVYYLLNFSNEDVVGIKEGHKDMEGYFYREEVDTITISHEKECRWRMVLGDKDGGIYD